MKRILFVDDDQQVLDGLRNMLRPQRKRWDMAFALGADAALVELAGEAFDVVVSDMRMPGMDGATLLKRVSEMHPRTVRVVLSGQTEMETALKSVSIAHQFLSKPCEADVLQNVLDRACSLSALLADEPLRQVVSSIKRLPTTPQVFLALQEALAHPQASLRTVSDILSRDVAICARVLQLVNSPFFGLGRRVTSVHEAVTYLGTTTIKSVVLSVESSAEFVKSSDCPGFSFDGLQRHSLFTANLARQLVEDKTRGESAFMAGMLHDIGILIAAMHFPGDAHKACAAGQASDQASHERLGAYLLGLWGLPYPIIEAVAHHQAPQCIEHPAFDVPDAVYVADRLAVEVFRDGRYGLQREEPLDEAYLAALGIAPAKIAAWRALAARMAGAHAG